MKWLNKILNQRKKVRKLNEQIKFVGDSWRREIEKHKHDIIRLNKLLSIHEGIRKFTQEPVWDEQDRKAFGELFQSDLGRKLDQFMCAKSQESDYKATLGQDTVRSSGYACGFRDAWFLVKSLSVGGTPQVADEYEIVSPAVQSSKLAGNRSV